MTQDSELKCDERGGTSLPQRSELGETQRESQISTTLTDKG
jgi:hypothetical protein